MMIATDKCLECFEDNYHNDDRKNRPWNFTGISIRGSCSYECTLIAFTHRCGLCLLTILSVITVLMTLLCLQYPEAIDNLLINQQLVDISTMSLTPTARFHWGRLEMASSTATILGVCKNNADELPNLLIQIEHLASSFQYSQAVFIVGDSTDNTMDLLLTWAAVSPKNRSIVPSSSEDLLIEAMGSSPFEGMKLPREGRIANARNIALTTMRSYMVQTDYVINLDMDIIGWNVDGIYASFEKRMHWDVVCANGILLHGVYRDTYAFRINGIDTNHHWSGDDHYLYNITTEQRQLNRHRLRESRRIVHEMLDSNKNNLRHQYDYDTVKQFIHVNSCFGGLAIYKWSALEGCNYHYRHSTPPYMLDCEHVLLNECITQQNKTIVINPNMKLWYGHSSLVDVDPKRAFNSLFLH